MPSPSSQNLRSAPQKQPKPKIAVSSPAGYGPFSGLPLTKCDVAVRIGLGRPGSASALDGMSSDFLKPNMVGPPEIVTAYIGRIGHFGTASGLTIRLFRRMALHTRLPTRSFPGALFPSRCQRLMLRPSNVVWRPYADAEDTDRRACSW